MLLSLFLLTPVYVNAQAATNISGAGASFPSTLYDEWFSAYHQKTGVTVNYSAIGSGGGIRKISNQDVDFAATDASLTDQELDEIDGQLLHIPTTLGGVAVAFYLPGIDNLRLSGPTLARIFRGQIAHWNHPDIKSENPGLKLPKLPITPIHRSDSSGTTFIFTDYLSNMDKTWAKKMGRGREIRWFGGIRARGNTGMLNTLSRTKGGIGYLEMSHLSTRLGLVHVQNNSGNYIAPSVQSVSLAADVDFPRDARLSLTNTSAEYGYPIAGISWILLYQDQHYQGRTNQDADATYALIKWMLSSEAQSMAPELGYGKMPDSGIRVSERLLNTVHFANQNLNELEY